MDSQIVEKLKKRKDGIRRWLGNEAPYVPCDQKHLDAGTVERAYWHYGYQAALDDALRVLQKAPSQK